MKASKAPKFREALKFWAYLGFISFGGPAGQIAIMHAHLVEKKKWISNSKFMHALNYCMILPGPEAQQLATYTGWLMHGTRGGLAAGILFVLPSMLILLALSALYVSFGHIPWIHALFSGLKPAVIAIVVLAMVKISKRALIGRIHYFFAAAAFVCIFFLNIPFPLIILGAIVVASATHLIFSNSPQNKLKQKESEEPEEYANQLNTPAHLQNLGFKPLRLLKQIIVACALWAILLSVLYILFPEFGFWKQLSVFFTKAALVTFGGAYAVLPYVAQVSVEQFKWLTNLQMMDGLALGETTPGPLIIVLVFVGFMAGYHHFGNSLSMGMFGLLVTTFYTFLPCFFFIFAGAPVIEKTRENKTLNDILSLVSAGVVGVVVNLTIYLSKAVLFPKEISLLQVDWIACSWTILSLFAMHRLKISMIKWIGISALFGLIVFVLNG